MPISIKSVFSPRVFPLLVVGALSIGASCAQAQIKSVTLQRFLLWGDRKKYFLVQRHIYLTNQEEYYKVIESKVDQSGESTNATLMPVWLPELVPFYRLKQKNGTKEFYTISEASAKEAVAKSGYLPNYDIIGYVSPVPTGDTVPLYRLYRGVKPKSKEGEVGYYDDHLYTTSDSEKQKAVKELGYVYEKVECYVWPQFVQYTSGGAPVGSNYRSVPYEKATNAIKSIHELHFGEPAANEKRTDLLIGKFWKMSPEMRQVYNQGLSAADAGKFARQLIQTDSAERSFVVNNAMMTVYGLPSFDIFNDPKGWTEPLKTGKADYNSIVAAETKKLNSDPAARRAMIERAYVRSMGRKTIDRLVVGKGMQGEQTYWGPRTENYAQIVKASNEWLYTPNGNKDLRETVARALKLKLNRVPTEKEVTSNVKKYTWNKVTFPEMIAPNNYYHYESQVMSAKPGPGINVVGGGTGTGGRPAPIRP